MENIMNLLPVGSVIRLRGATKNIMIFGVCQTNAETQVTYEYIGVLWPEGNMGVESQIMFHHADIEEVVFVGMDNQERQTFLKKLSEFYASQKNL